MIGRLLYSDFLKNKRTSIALVVILMPFLTMLLQAINYLLRTELVLESAARLHVDLWTYLLIGTHRFLIISFPLMITMIASIIPNIEHQSNSWKQMMTLPVNKYKIYISKFLNLLIWSFIAIALLCVVFPITGIILGIEGKIPFDLVLKEVIYIYFAFLPIISFQLWLSMSIKNQAISISIGIITTMSGLFLVQRPITQWLIWAYPSLVMPIVPNNQFTGVLPNQDLIKWFFLSLIMTVVMLILGMRNFVQKEV
ncbi:ABC transporter permease [Thermoflavimicrobium daqui]|jgi:hypothetical protein|uniref:Permease n=1 Tax=Thermoflavimicrobium daqui TaxID=2137476 RepID=A0A364K9G7_9BACL|nr:ABC transporter permease [Thermoflavimicrobium daqui]RAL26934.1 permease [Thermoflavimicrobium daqui]